jgi:hypothetical protein
MAAGLQLKLQGYTPANRDATVRLVHEATGRVVERKPFLDGTLLVRDLEPGFYEVEVTHPNLSTPIEKKKIRIFDQGALTYVPVTVNPDIFFPRPPQDQAIADLGPVQQMASAVRESLRPLDGKSPGEAIRAADWNALVGAVDDLAAALLQMTHLLAPRGHDHAGLHGDLVAVKEDVRKFSESFGRSVLELRRDLEITNLKHDIGGILDAGAATADMRDRVSARMADLERAIQSDTGVFTGRLAGTGALVLGVINELAAARGAEADAFLNREDVKTVSTVARHYAEAGVQVRAEAELHIYERAAAATGGKTVSRAVRR